MPEFANPAWLWLLIILLPVTVWLRMRAHIAESRFKRITGMVLRCISVTLLIVTLAGLLKSSESVGTDIVFVLDVSRSVDQETSRDAVAFINRVLASRDPLTRTGLVVFGADAAVERLLSESTESIAETTAQVNRGGTDISQAIELAVSLFQDNRQRRLVVLSDGQQNPDGALSAAQVARSLGVTIDTVELLSREDGNDILIQSIIVSSRIHEREPFNVDVAIVSQTNVDAHLTITRNGSPIKNDTVTLRPGMNTYTLVDQAESPGLYEYEAIINSAQDQVSENNRFQTFVQVKGASRVLHAVGDSDAGRHVTSALRAQGLQVDEIASVAIPASLHELVEYDLIILNNVSALDMSLAKMQIMSDYIRDAGGGLLTLGGDKSYGAGGYHDTPIEQALPVTMDIKTDVEIPTLAVTVIIDRSGSMQSGDKLTVAKNAAFSAIQVMKPKDTVGVLVFANVPEWSVPPREVGNRSVMVERLRQINSGGSTDLHSALVEAHRVMKDQPARLKHLILLSDGLSDRERDINGLVERIADSGITISAVAFGNDADQTLMERIANKGGGRYYYTPNAEDVPRIFTSETLVVSRNLFVEEEVQPHIQYPGELLKDFDQRAFPALSGYQRVFPKPSAQVLLRASEEDPLLTAWRYGLGKSVAFASDMSGRWTKAWITWDQFSRFVAQTARWTMRHHGSEQLITRFERSGQSFDIIVDAFDRDDRFVNGLELTGTVVDPKRTTSTLALEQIAPGQYRGKFDAPAEGRYYVNLGDSTGELQTGIETFGLAVPYSSEYLALGTNSQLLSSIAQATGGHLLSLRNSAIPTLLRSESGNSNHRERLWWPMLLAALVLLIVEITIRKLSLPESWQHTWHRVVKGGRPASPTQPDYDELVAEITRTREHHLSALKNRSGYDHNDATARARLYIAGQNNRQR